MFQIQAIKNLSQPSKTAYENSKEGMLQLILYPGNVVAIEMEKLACFEKDLFDYESRKVRVD